MSLAVNRIDISNNNVSIYTKSAATIGSLIGVTAALGSIASKRGLKFPPSLKNTKQIADIFKKMELNDKDVMVMASSSIAGGFLGGVLTDRKNTKAKVKEGLIQLIGNYIVPSLFVGAGIKLNKALNNRYKFPPTTKTIQFAFGFVSLIAGVLAGNKVSRIINSQVFDEKGYRKLDWKDWAVQADNACLVTSMAAEGTTIAKTASKIIPFSHLIPGYCVGIKKSN